MSMRYRIVLKMELQKDIYGRTMAWPVLSPTDDEITMYKTWCKEHVGQNGWNYYGQYKKVPYEFRFKCSEDLLAFKLTFGFL